MNFRNGIWSLVLGSSVLLASSYIAPVELRQNLRSLSDNVWSLTGTAVLIKYLWFDED